MKRASILLMMILSCIALTAQTLAKNDPLKFDADYYMMEKDFTKALNTYKNILRSEPDNADIKYKTGICYLNSENEKDQAIPFLEEASLKISEKYNSNSFDETNAPVDALFLLGSAYRVNNQIDKAIESYKKYRTYLDPKDEYNLNVVDQYIKSCELAASMQQRPIEVTMSNLGSIVNNEFPNYNAVLSGDGKTMFYTSPARQGYDIFLTTFQDSAWSAPKNVTTVLGTGKYMRTSDLSYDGNILLLTLDDAMNSDIYICRFNKGKWSKAEPLGKEINSKFNETHASLSNDGRVLYFTSDRKGGQGDLDIYKAEPDDKGLWDKPVNLGPLINTPLNEETPFVAEIGDRLYFSSEGHNGIGGYDIYFYDFSNPSKGVVNLGFPVNTTDNDLFFVPAGDGHTAY
ncbi:MAG TPA: tetratricopeptide repeat protein, partial [Bacteroidales bacterium]|nr:tetratricopeptide repeat protein [Bacteroidales bacterium]